MRCVNLQCVTGSLKVYEWLSKVCLSIQACLIGGGSRVLLAEYWLVVIDHFLPSHA